MILKFIEALIERKGLLLAILAIPTLAIFFLANYRMQILPEYEYVSYEVSFAVPGNVSSFIEDKVTKEAERVFNGLPKLMSMESVTNHEDSRIRLQFEKGSDPSNVLLFIQEKMDRLKLSLPGDVKRISINQLERVTPPDITLHSEHGIAPELLKKTIHPYNDRIRRYRPELNESTSATIELDVKKMAQDQIAVDQVWKALQLNSMTYKLGSQKDLSFTVETSFDDVEAIRAIIVGARDDRPVRLSNIARVVISTPKPVKKFQVWVNKDRTTTGKIKKMLQEKLPDVSLERTYQSLWLKYMFKLLPGFLLVVGLQYCFFLLTFRSKQALWAAGTYNVLFFIHYFFWVGFLRNEITLLDMHAFMLSYIIGSVFWAVLLFRIRTYFVPSKLPTFIRRTLAQASLFSIAEYLPTFIVLFVLSVLFSAPFLLSEVNLPSQTIIMRMFFYGIPVNLVLLCVLPIITPLHWIHDDVHLENPAENFTKLLPTHYFWPVLVCFILSLVFWYLQPFGIRNHDQQVNDKFSYEKEIVKYRNYGSSLTFHSKERHDDENFIYHPVNSSTKEWMYQWSITPTGMAKLSNYNISQFQTALFDIQHKKGWGSWLVNDNKIPLTHSQLSLSQEKFANLLLAPNSKEIEAARLGLILSPEVTLFDKRIFHSQLDRVNQFTVSDKLTDGNFLHKQTRKLKRSPHTKFWFSQYELFLKNKWIVLIFTFILISLYLNSFVRGALLTLTCFAVELTVSLFSWLFGVPYHLDSLWLSWMPLWITLFIMLTLSRMTDVERSRGNDRDAVLSEVERYFATVCKWSFYFIGASLIVWSLLDRIPLVLSPTTTFEGIFIGILTLGVGFLTYMYLFRLFYVTEDEFLEDVTFRVLLQVKKLKERYLK